MSHFSNAPDIYQQSPTAHNDENTNYPTVNNLTILHFPNAHLLPHNLLPQWWELPFPLFFVFFPLSLPPLPFCPTTKDHSSRGWPTRKTRACAISFFQVGFADLLLFCNFELSYCCVFVSVFCTFVLLYFCILLACAISFLQAAGFRDLRFSASRFARAGQDARWEGDGKEFAWEGHDHGRIVFGINTVQTLSNGIRCTKESTGSWGSHTHTQVCMFWHFKTLQERQMPTLGQCREKLAQEVRLQVLWLDDKE